MKKRIIAFLMVFVLLIVSFVAINPVGQKASAKTQSELEDTISELNGKIKSYKSKLAGLEKDKDSNEEYLSTLKKQIAAVEEKAASLETQINSLDTQIEGYNNQITQLENEISVIQDEIEATQKEIKKTQDEIGATKDGLARQLKIDYIQGKDSTLKILMGSKSLAGFLTSLELMKKTSEAENKLINGFKKQVTRLKAAKQKLVDNKTKVKDKKVEVEDTRKLSIQKKDELVVKQADYKKTVSELEGDYSKIENYIGELDRNSAIYKSYIENAESERNKADAELDKVISQYYATSQKQTTTLYAANNDTTKSGGSSGGGNTQAQGGASYPSSASWAWPLGNASCYISSNYGYRSASIGGNAFHGGLDIAGGGIYGKPVYASRAGKVVTAVYGTTGYGRYVIIDHGDGFTTVYGHCSSLCVSAGQTVSKGQHIANVGSTGNSTGPHLHFEVRHNGQKQNPLNYVKKP